MYNRKGDYKKEKRRLVYDSVIQRNGKCWRKWGVRKDPLGGLICEKAVGALALSRGLDLSGSSTVGALDIMKVVVHFLHLGVDPCALVL